ncbi:class I SAM-dependent methyltransferase [archaeon]|nr:MAG: class I SAM-dependent methyltransferase [archaeon]
MSDTKTAERVMPGNFSSKEEYIIYLRHLFAYEFAKSNIPKNSSVLEVGCGEGYGTSMLSKSVAKIIGIDPDKDTISHASEKYGSGNCTFSAYDGTKIPYDDGTFDAVVCFQVIEHVKDDAGFISEINRVLKSGGILILTTPNKALRLKVGQKPWNRFHVREYYANELEDLLRNFQESKVMGIQGNNEIQKIETDRINQIQHIVKLDPLNLRKLMPNTLKSIAIKVLKRKKTAGSNDFLEKYSLKDFHIVNGNLEESLDILGLCKKIS